jgi:hypothetical protein
MDYTVTKRVTLVKRNIRGKKLYSLLEADECPLSSSIFFKGGVLLSSGSKTF